MTFSVSVCIPAYRQPEALVRTVKSVLLQKNCVFEIVITDDSIDDTVKNALGELLNDIRVRYFKNPKRLGAIGNWNASIKNAKNDIIKILHHDDWFINEDGLYNSIQPIASGKTLVLFSACNAMSFKGSELFSHVATIKQIEMLKNRPDELIYGNFIGPPSVVTFSRKALVQFNPKYIWLSDVDFYIRLIHKAKGDFIYHYTPLVNVTSDSPEQLSRECELQRLRSLKENISLFAESEASKKQKKLGVHFFSLAYGLSLREIFEAIRFALHLGEFRIISVLIKGLLFSITNFKK